MHVANNLITISYLCTRNKRWKLDVIHIYLAHIGLKGEVYHITFSVCLHIHAASLHRLDIVLESSFSATAQFTTLKAS